MKPRTVSIAIAIVCICSAALIFSEVHQLELFDLIPSSITHGSFSSSFDTIEFEGASEFLILLRTAHRKKIANPPPHCQEQHSKVNVFNRAIEIDWIGRNISAVEPTWSSFNRSSCNFVGLAFPPTKGALHAALQQTTYISSFHTVSQCISDSFQWENDKPFTCLGNNFGGTLGANTEKGCIEEAVGGYQMKLWNEQNSNDALFQCLKYYLDTDEVLREVDITTHMEDMIANVTRLDYVSQRGYSRDDTDWSTLAFLLWSETALKLTGILEAANITTSEQIIRNLQRMMAVIGSGKNTTVTKCVAELLPPMIGNKSYTPEEQRVWKDTGAYLSTSTMQESPSSLLRNLPGSLHGVLPPSPTAIYSVHALLGEVVNVNSEAYFPGCTPYWNAILRQEAPPKKAFIETDLEAKKNGTIFANWKNSRHYLRNEIIKTCAEDDSKCPFPTFDLVIDITQVYCGGFFHWMIEIWPRIGPFLDGLLSENMPKFAIRIGCESSQIGFHPQFFGLVGFENITLIDSESPVFAKEVIAPTEGFSHSPLLNYWNLVAMRQKVFSHLGPIEKSENKTVLVIIRDASRRPDANIFNRKFLNELSDGLPDIYRVVPFRSSDKKMMACMACQARAFMLADVIIGSHGAGLSHTLFAPAGAAILERVDKSDSGIYSELAFMLGMKYFPMDVNTHHSGSYIDMITLANGY